MNEFGTPYNDAEEAMRPKGIGHRHIDKQIATSGLESQWGWIVGGALSLVGSIIGGNKSSNAARQQAQSQNEATNRQL